MHQAHLPTFTPFIWYIWPARAWFFFPCLSVQVKCQADLNPVKHSRWIFIIYFLFKRKKHWRFLHPAVLKRLDCRPLGRSEVCGMWSWSICFQVWTSFSCFLMTAQQFVAPVMPSCRTCVNQKCQQGFTFQTGVTNPNHPDAIFNKTEICCLPIKYWQNLCILTFKM